MRRRVVAYDRDGARLRVAIDDIGREAGEIVPPFGSDYLCHSFASEGLYALEHVCRPVSDLLGVVVCNSLGISEKHTRLLDELLGRLIDADHRILRIVGSLIDIKHLLHRCHEGTALSGKDHPFPFRSMACSHFFKTLPTVAWEMEGTISSTTSLSASNLSDHCECPAGGLLQASATSLAYCSPSSIRGRWKRSAVRPVSASSMECSTQSRFTR